MPNTLEELYNDLRLSYGTGRGQASASSDDPLILRLIQLIVSCAVQARASDIHIKPNRAGARMRYRIEEVLRVTGETGEADL